MVKVTFKPLIMVTLVNTLMASLVVLVVDLVRIAFANARITVIPQFAKFIGKILGSRSTVVPSNSINSQTPYPFLNTVWAVVVM